MIIKKESRLSPPTEMSSIEVGHFFSDSDGDIYFRADDEQGVIAITIQNVHGKNNPAGSVWTTDGGTAFAPYIDLGPARSSD